MKIDALKTVCIATWLITTTVLAFAVEKVLMAKTDGQRILLAARVAQKMISLWS